jgi:acyl-CoA reductase-like NAD-dependent aldehyde dehydrogenase
MPEQFVVAGQWRSSQDVMPVIFPYDGSVAGEVYMASERDIEEAIASTHQGFQITRKLPSHKRSEILRNLHDLMKAHMDEFVRLMILESGKNHKTAVAEMSRALQTIMISSEEARRLGGEVFSIDWTPAGENRQGFTRRAPIGTVLAVTPFNYPINLACHKIGPAIAVGNSLILKPAEKAPLSSVLLAKLILEAGYPPQAFSMIQAYGPQTEKMAIDPRIAMLSFTGSAAVGWMLKNKVGQKKVALELGGNAGAIVHDDADLKSAVSQTAAGAFTNTGQNCISVQRILIQQRIFEEFTDHFLAAVKAMKIGDPRDPQVDIGPMINEREAIRLESWVDEAVSAGASVLLGGPRQGAMFPPHVLTQTTREMKVSCLEAFGPIVTLMPYQEWDEAVATLNDGEYGLQAGIFTRDIKRIMQAWEDIEVGGLQVNSVSTFRVDHMPYGGIKASGFGREGVKYTIEEMTELRLMVVNLN